MNGALKGCDLRAGQKESYINLSVRNINLPEPKDLSWSISASRLHFLRKHFSKVSQPAHLSWKWCFYLELIFPNTVSVSMICSYRLLREKWSHRRNSDISMTFSAEREKEIISLSFFLIQCWVRDGVRRGRESFLPTNRILLVATLDDMPQCSFLYCYFLRCLRFPWYHQLRIHYRDTYVIMLLKFETFQI